MQKKQNSRKTHQWRYFTKPPKYNDRIYNDDHLPIAEEIYALNEGEGTFDIHTTVEIFYESLGINERDNEARDQYKRDCREKLRRQIDDYECYIKAICHVLRHAKRVYEVPILLRGAFGKDIAIPERWDIGWESDEDEFARRHEEHMRDQEEN